MMPAQPCDGAARASAWSLAEGVLLLTWDAAPSADSLRVRPFIDGRPAPAPFARNVATTLSASERHFIAVRTAASGPIRSVIEIRESAEAGAALRPLATAVVDGAAAAPADPALLLAGLDDAGRCKAVRFLVETVGSLFKLGQERGYAAFCLEVFRELFERPARLTAHCTLLAHTILTECPLPAGFGEPLRAVVIGGGRMRALAPSAFTVVPLSTDGARHSLAVLLPAAVAASGAALFLLTDGAIAGRLLAPRRDPLPPAACWLEAGTAAARRLSYPLIDAAARLAGDDPIAEATARELAIIAAGERDRGIAGKVDVAAAGAAGLLVRGWLTDRNDFIEAIEGQRLRASHEFPIASLHRFAHAGAAAGGAGCGQGDSAGFTFLLPWGEQPPVPLASLVLSLRLKSGSRLPLWQGQPTLADAAVIGRILAERSAGGPSAAGEGSGDAAVAMIEPWLRPEQERRASQVTLHELTTIGVPVENAAISVVTPLAEDPHLLRCTVTMLATAVRQRPTDIVFVADQAHLRHDQTRLLRGLAEAFGLSGRLAVFASAAGTGSLINGGAIAAQAPVLVLLGAGVVAEQPDWLDRLAGMLDRADGERIVAARILAEDQSVRDAGMRLDDDARGRFDLAGCFDGFPRDYPDAASPRVVDAVSAAAIAMPRPVFESAGGFDDRYLTDRYRDADFCFEFRRQGGRVLALPEPVLFALGGTGDRAVAPSARETALMLDRRLFEARWRGVNLVALAAGGNGGAGIGNLPVGVAA